MHNFHIIHRDIKLSNCMLNPTTGKFVLVDFGISQPVNENHQTPTYTTYCGTRQYITNEIKALRWMTFKQGFANLYWADMYAYDVMIDKMEELQ
jgi:serine/threonine protein kinase